ncbi:MAG: hypothetical protein HYV63_10825 [Candidatus Schekmanbacteria bacterium]|nr:hypothetical protein [Candidatus Schekmanbacteria bacterium]
MRNFDRFPMRIGVICGMFALLAGTAHGDYCIGESCGAGKLGWHCHGVSQAGEECWDALDDNCEEVGRWPDACPDRALNDPLATSTLAPTFIGSYNIFAGEIRQGAAPRLLRRDLEAEEAGDEEEGEEEVKPGVQAAKKRRAYQFSTMTTNLERESWSLDYTKLGAGTIDGTTLGARFNWVRQSEGGGLFGFNLSHQQAEPDGASDKTSLSNLNMLFGHTIGRERIVRWTLGLAVTHLDAVTFDSTLLGGNAKVYVNKFFANGMALSGGVVGQASYGKDEDTASVGAGAAFGVPFADRFAVDFDVYGVKVLRPDSFSDVFYTVGSIFSFYISPRFALALGARGLFGLQDVKSTAITFGTSTRW